MYVYACKHVCMYVCVCVTCVNTLFIIHFPQLQLSSLDFDNIKQNLLSNQIISWSSLYILRMSHIITRSNDPCVASQLQIPSFALLCDTRAGSVITPLPVHAASGFVNRGF